MKVTAKLNQLNKRENQKLSNSNSKPVTIFLEGKYPKFLQLARSSVSKPENSIMIVLSG